MKSKNVLGSCVLHFNTPQAMLLQGAMADAREALNKAEASYQGALASAQGPHQGEVPLVPEPNRDKIVALLQEGQAYAQALMQYSNAVMAWLVYVKKHASLSREKGLGAPS